MSSLKRTRAEEWSENPRPAKKIAPSLHEWPLQSDHQFAGDVSTYKHSRGTPEANGVPLLVSDETCEPWDENRLYKWNQPLQWTTDQTSPLFRDWLWDGRKPLDGFDGYTGEEHNAADPFIKEQHWNGLGTPLCFPPPATHPLSTPEALDSVAFSEFTTPTPASFVNRGPPPIELCFGTVRTSGFSLLLTIYCD